MTKKDYEEILQIYKDQIESFKAQIQELREDKAKLQEQNFRLQDSIMNVRAPEAYRDMAAARLPEPEALTPEEKEKNEKYAYTYASIMKQFEEPLFKTADDIFTMLTPAINSKGGPSGTKSIHDNDES